MSNTLPKDIEEKVNVKREEYYSAVESGNMLKEAHGVGFDRGAEFMYSLLTTPSPSIEERAREWDSDNNILWDWVGAMIKQNQGFKSLMEILKCNICIKRRGATPKDSEVYNQEECVYVYCPHSELCKNGGCLAPKQKAASSMQGELEKLEAVYDDVVKSNSDLQGELERVRGLLKKIFYNIHKGLMPKWIDEKWEQFKTENNL